MKLSVISEFLAANGFPNEIEGDSGVTIRAANTLEDAGEGDISFLANPKYTDLLCKTRASVVIVKPDVDMPNGKTTIRCADPYAAITATMIRLHGHREHPRWDRDEHAIIAPTATIGSDANIGPFVTIGENVRVGSNATIYPGCFVAENVNIGDDVTLFPNVVIYDGSRLGDRVTIHAGSVIGEDGLGYAPVDDKWLKIPQVGRVVIEDDVEIGACCAFNRATLGETLIGAGTKFSDSVVVGHGTKIGEHCMIVAQVGIAGSTRIGHHVTLAGQAGISGHLTIGDRARVGAQSGVMNDLEPGADYLGFPATESARFRRQLSLVRKLPEMKQHLVDLESEVQRLREQLENHVDARP